MPPLPPPLAQVVGAPVAGGKRERTQGQLVQAAIQVFGARGVAAATIQEVAQVAGMTTGTVYNHFSTKEALVERVAITLAETLCRVIAGSAAEIPEGAERMAIGQRRYIWLAAQSPAWALLLLDVARAAPHLMELIEKYTLADLRLGVKQKAFKVPSEAAALDAIGGVCSAAMQRVALGLAPRSHDVAAATLVLRALGMPPEAAAEVAKRPLPPLKSPAG